MTDDVERIPLEQHTPETLAELYDQLEDADAFAEEARQACQDFYQSLKSLNGLLYGVSRAVTAVWNRIRVVDQRDWTANRHDAWLYGVVIGWDEEALPAVAERHGWKPDRVANMQEMRALLAPITTPPPSQTRPEAR